MFFWAGFLHCTLKTRWVGGSFLYLTLGLDDSASVFVSTHWWSQRPACQCWLFLVVSYFYKLLVRSSGGTYARRASKVGPSNDSGIRRLNWKQHSKTPYSIIYCTVFEVCGSCASFHNWTPNPHERLLTHSLQYKSWWKFVREMTPFWHHPSFIVELLVHQSHIQATSPVHQSECIMINTTKHYITHNNIEVLPLMYVPLIPNNVENPSKITVDLESPGVEPMTFESRSFFESFCKLLVQQPARYKYKFYLLALVSEGQPRFVIHTTFQELLVSFTLDEIFEFV